MRARSYIVCKKTIKPILAEFRQYLGSQLLTQTSVLAPRHTEDYHTNGLVTLPGFNPDMGA